MSIFSHQTERRGCGYTQATRVIAEFVLSRVMRLVSGFTNFDDYETKGLRNILNRALPMAWNLPLGAIWILHADVQQCLQRLNPEETFARICKAEVDFQAKLRKIHQYAELEESILILPVAC